MEIKNLLNVIWNLTKLKFFSKTHLGFYADVNFLYGHTKKFVKNYLNPKEEIKLKIGWNLLSNLPIVIFYSTFGESQLRDNLQFENPTLPEEKIKELFEKSIKGLPINKLEVPYSNGFITPTMIRGFKNLDKKYEDVIHIAIASNFEFPLITGEKGKELELFKNIYNLTISTSKFWNYVNHLYEEKIMRKKIDKEFALNFLHSKNFL